MAVIHTQKIETELEWGCCEAFSIPKVFLIRNYMRRMHNTYAQHGTSSKINITLISLNNRYTYP
jgi:hypothetical protein